MAVCHNIATGSQTELGEDHRAQTMLQHARGGFDCIGGLEDVIKSLREMVLLPIMYPQLFCNVKLQRRVPDTQMYATHVVCSCWGIVFASGKEDMGIHIKLPPYPTFPTIPVPVVPRTCGAMKYHHSLIHTSVSCVTEVAISCC